MNIMNKEERYARLMAICYVIAGTIEDSIETGKNIDADLELLLNTLSRPDGPGADILLRNDGAYQDFMLEAILAENENV